MNIELIAIITIFLGSAYLIYTNLGASFYLMLLLSVLLHKELFSFYHWDLLPIRAFAFAFLCAYAFKFGHLLLHPSRFAKSIKDLFLNPQTLPLFVFWVIAGVSLYFTRNIRASIFLFGFLTTSLVVFAVFYDHIKKHPELPLKYLKFYIYTVFGLTLFGYFQYFLYFTTGRIVGAFWNIPGNIPRVGSLFWDVNHFAALLAVLLPISSTFVLTEKDKKNKFLFFLISLSLLVTLLLTNSRTAWIIDFVAFIVFAIMFLLKKYGLKGILILLIPLLLLTSGMGWEYSKKDSPFRAKVKQYFHYRLDSFDSHMLLLQGTIEIWREFPILGGGYGGFFEHFSSTKTAAVFFGRDPAAFNTRVPAHTIWGELLSGTGILGFSAFMFFICTLIFTQVFAAWYSSDWRDSILHLVLGASVVGWMIGGIFYSYNSEFFWLVLSIFSALGYASLVKLNRTYASVLNFVYSSKRLHAFVIVSIAFVLIFWSLGSTSLIPWDEAIYAKISKNIYTSGNYIDLSWKQGSVWYEKPPLYMWMSALLMHIIGSTSIAVRLPSALLALLTVVLVYKFASKHFGKLTGYISALALITTTNYLYYARTGMTDVSTTFFITIAFFIYLENFKSSGDQSSESERKSLLRSLLIGLFLGFATLTKGVIGLIPFSILLLSDLLIARKFRFKNYFVMFLSWAAVALPWHILMYIRYGQPFLMNYVGYHVFDRALNAIEDKGNPFWWYAIVLKVSMRIWFIPFILSWLMFFDSKIRNDKRFLFILLWFSVFFTFFSAAQSKLVWYITPVYPAVSILAGYSTVFIMRKVLGLLPFEDKLKIGFSTVAITIFALSYLGLNSKLVYTGDLTGAQARLMELKEDKYGTKDRLYLDRIELPLALYYLDGPFEVIDFSSTKKERVPQVDANQRLYLLTKKGRFSETVAGYSYAPTVVAEDGDWILWFFEPRSKQKVTSASPNLK